MADTQFTTQPQTTPPKPDSPPSSKRRKVIGQCPTCAQSFASRHELRAHMSDPSHHTPASDSDAISFGELSSEYDSADEPAHSYRGSTLHAQHDDEPTLETDGFEFSSAGVDKGAGMHHHDDFDFDFARSEAEGFSPVPAPDQGSVYSLPDGDEQPSAEYTPIEIPPVKSRVVRGGALGVLYCGTCEKLFGNERVFKRHFMFSPRHGAEERDVRELYYRVWGQSWGEEARGRGRGRGQERVEEVDEMEM